MLDADRLHGRSDDTDELLAEDELLVEEISIDGMCGVY
jgi:mycofactocin precursor